MSPWLHQLIKIAIGLVILLLIVFKMMGGGSKSNA